MLLAALAAFTFVGADPTAAVNAMADAFLKKGGLTEPKPAATPEGVAKAAGVHMLRIAAHFGPAVDQSAACKAVGLTTTAGPPASPGARPLETLPPAKEYHLVLRKIGDCQVADVVRFDPNTGARTVVHEPVGGALDRVTPTGRILPAP